MPPKKKGGLSRGHPASKGGHSRSRGAAVVKPRPLEQPPSAGPSVTAIGAAAVVAECGVRAAKTGPRYTSPASNRPRRSPGVAGKPSPGFSEGVEPAPSAKKGRQQDEAGSVQGLGLTEPD